MCIGYSSDLRHLEAYEPCIEQRPKHVPHNNEGRQAGVAVTSHFPLRVRHAC